MALAVPLSRITPRVGGGSAFFVRPHYTFMKLSHLWFLLLVLAFGSLLPMRAAAQTDLEQRVSTLELKIHHHDGAEVGVLVCAAFLALWAQNTGRNAWLWFFLGLFFSVIVIFVMLYKNSNDRKIGKR